MEKGLYLAFRSVFFSLSGPIKGGMALAGQPGIYLSSLAQLLLWYVSKLVIPDGILYLWTIEQVKAVDWPAVLGLFSLAGLAGYLILGRWKRGTKAWALSIFLLGLLPTLAASFAYFPEGKPMIEPHWFYFSSIGFFLLAAQYLVGMRARTRRGLWAAALAVVVAANAVLLKRSNAFWRDQETYCRYWLSLNKTNATPYYWLGRSLLEKEDYNGAVECFVNSLNASGFSPMLILTDLAYAQYLGGQRAEAKAYLENAVQFGPNYSLLYYYLGRIYLQEGDYGQSREMLGRAVQLFPANKEYRELLAAARQRL